MNVTCLELLRIVFNFRRFNYLCMSALVNRNPFYKHIPLSKVNEFLAVVDLLSELLEVAFGC